MDSTQGVGGGDHSNLGTPVTGQVSIKKTSSVFGRTTKRLYVDPKDENMGVYYETLGKSGNVFSRMKESLLTGSGKFVVTEINVEEKGKTKTKKVAINVNSLKKKLGITEDEAKYLKQKGKLGETIEKVSKVRGCLEYSSATLKDITKHVTRAYIRDETYIRLRENMVGFGTFGTVYKVKILSLENFRERSVAEKRANKHMGLKAIQDLKNEERILKSIDEFAFLIDSNEEALNGIQEVPWNVSYHGQNAVMTGRLYEGTMSDKMNEMSPSQKIKAMDPLLKGLAFIQEKGIVHVDIKPENIFVDTIDGKKVFRLADFGGARWEKELNNCSKDYDVICTPFYTPEKEWDSLGESLTIDNADSLQKIGTYQMGVSLYEALSGEASKSGYERPTEGSFDRGPLEKKGIPKDVIDFVALLCHPDPTKRPTGNAILQKWQRIVEKHGGIEKLAEEADRGT